VRTLAVTAYTPGYSDLRIRLESSCIAHGVDLLAVPYDSSGDWTKNGHIKPEALLKARAAHPGRPVAWIDADAIVRSVPDLFDAAHELGASLAFHTVPKTKEVLSGTVWVAPDPNVGASTFLHRWAMLCEECPEEWDQVLMGRAAKWAAENAGAVVGSLPAEYCWVDFMAEPRWGGPRAPVIEHTQASRDVRAGKRVM
jgi:hypothetical protein